MKVRILLIAATLLFAAVAAGTPTAAAQGGNYIQAKLDWEHADMTVPDTGRADMGLVTKLEASGFVCAPPDGCTITAQIQLQTFTKWAGASLEPFTATFKIPAGAPGPNPVIYTSTEEIKLNLAWDLETAPRTGAKQIYVAEVGTDKYAVQGTPVPQYQPRAAKSAPMTATLPDRPAEVNASTAVDCSMDPFNPACANAATTAAAESPGIDAGILLASLAMFAVVFRRRRE